MNVGKHLTAMGLVVLFGCSGAAFAQDAYKPGLTLSLFGSLDFAKTETNGTKSDNNTGIVNALVGYFVTESVEVGAGLGYSLSTSSGTETTSLFLQPYGKYYFGAVGKKGDLSPYIGVAGLFGSQTSSAAGSQDLNFIGYKGFVGAEYFVAERTSLLGQISYQQYETDGNLKTTYTSAPLLEFGLKLYF
jgi:hypothetical protein